MFLIFHFQDALKCSLYFALLKQTKISNFGRVILVKDLLQRDEIFQRDDPFVIAGMVPEQADKMAEKARGRDGDGEEAARRGRGRRRRG